MDKFVRRQTHLAVEIKAYQKKFNKLLKTLKLMKNK
jgi:hypothetical protein